MLNKNIVVFIIELTNICPWWFGDDYFSVVSNSNATENNYRGNYYILGPFVTVLFRYFSSRFLAKKNRRLFQRCRASTNQNPANLEKIDSTNYN